MRTFEHKIKKIDERTVEVEQTIVTKKFIRKTIDELNQDKVFLQTAIKDTTDQYNQTITGLQNQLADVEAQIVQAEKTLNTKGGQDGK